MAANDEMRERSDGSRSNVVLLAAVRLLVRTFFRSVDVTGANAVPRDRGGLLLAWHPNGLVDPCLITATFPGRVAFGAKHSLFGWPVIGRLLRAFGAVPVYRRTDDSMLTEQERRAANSRSLERLAGRIAGGAYAALFPEGVSHDEPFVFPLKTGAARLYYAARAAGASADPAPVIIPVGLHYADKHLFRSQALVWFYPPLELPAPLDVRPDPGEDEEVERGRVLELTRLIESALESAVHPTEDWTTHRLINRVRKLVRAERASREGVASDRPTFEERIMGFARVQRAYYERLASHPEQAERLRRRVAEYDEAMTALGLDDHELDSVSPVFGAGMLLRTALNFVFVFVLLPPLLLLGYLVNGPPALIVYAVTKRLAKEPSVMATHKVILGAVLFPLTWLGVIVAGILVHPRLSAAFPRLPDVPALTGIVLSLLSIVGAAHVLRYQAVARQAFENLRVRFLRKRRPEAIARTRASRAAIYDEIMRIATELGLIGPGPGQGPESAAASAAGPEGNPGEAD